MDNEKLEKAIQQLRDHFSNLDNILGYCEECGTQTVRSACVLAGII